MLQCLQKSSAAEQKQAAEINHLIGPFPKEQNKYCIYCSSLKFLLQDQLQFSKNVLKIFSICSTENLHTLLSMEELFIEEHSQQNPPNINITGKCPSFVNILDYRNTLQEVILSSVALIAS